MTNFKLYYVHSVTFFLKVWLGLQIGDQFKCLTSIIVFFSRAVMCFECMTKGEAENIFL